MFSRGSGIEGEMGISRESFGNGEDGDPLVIAFEFTEILGIVLIGDGDDESLGIALRTPLGITSDTGGRNGRSQSPFPQTAVETEWERAKLQQ